MKYLIILLSLIILSCEEKYPKYELATHYEISDSLKSKKLDFIIKSMSATDFHLTTSDYEDPEDVVQELDRIFDNTFSEKVEGLNIHLSEYNYIFKPYSKLDSSEKRIFINLYSKQKEN